MTLGTSNLLRTGGTSLGYCLRRMLGTACDRCAALNVLRRDGVRKFLILHTERTLNKDNGSSPGKSRNRKLAFAGGPERVGPIRC